MSASRITWLLPLLLLGCPSEDPDPGPTDDDDAAPAPGNSSPTMPGISISPAAPGVDEDVECTIDVESVDPDGDEVTYTYAWFLDDEDAGVDTATLPAARTGAEEWWTCAVTASDGELSSSAAEATVEVGHVNQPPTAPTVEITPDDPSTRQNLNCSASGATDLEGAEVTYTYAWGVDGGPATLPGEAIVAGETAEGEEWTCVATASDGELETTGEATVTIGPACYSLDFSGDGYVSVHDAPELRLFETDFTVEAWVRRTGTDGSQQTVAYKRGTGNEEGWGLYVDIDGNAGNFAWVQSRGGDPALAATSTELPGTWTHVAYSYDWDANAGEGTGTFHVGGFPAGSDILPSPSGTADAALNIGRDGAFDSHYFDGQLDDVRISSIARYDGLFNPANQAIVADADTIAVWRLEEGEGTLAQDTGPNGFHGTVVEGTWTAATSACTAAR